MSKTIRFNAFEMNCVAHQSPGLWTHPRDRSWQYKDLEYWTDLGRILERSFFDAVFIADVIGYYDVYQGSNDHAIREGAQLPVNDPLQLAAPIALATRHLGIGVTASTSFEHPYPFARRLSTLDHHTKGRVGWNIVTSYLESGAKNISQGGLRQHDNRYDVAVEYLVPELQRRGVYQTEYRPGTLREKLFGAGPLLPDNHPAAQYRDIEAWKQQHAQAVAADLQPA
jgi:alkanesulfonate monooxygenase SsuD/methylene tetrahydromethanopterin reductase-like flavin-dependent oxidoreductase (luciferase family)